MQDKRGKGRPKIMPDIKKVEDLASQGLTLDQVASCLGISYQTLNERSKEYSEFADAIKRGQDKGISIVTNALMENALKGNVTAQIFYLKCRARWKENKEIEGDAKSILENLMHTCIDEKEARQ